MLTHEQTGTTTQELTKRAVTSNRKAREMTIQRATGKYEEKSAKAYITIWQI